jgi:hypothetical protein
MAEATPSSTEEAIPSSTGELIASACSTAAPHPMAQMSIEALIRMFLAVMSRDKSKTRAKFSVAQT